MGQTRNGNDQHCRKKVLHDAVDFSRHSIDTDVVIAAQNAEDRRVRADVQRRRQRGGKDDHNGLEMGLPVDLPCKVDGTIPPGAEIVEDIGAHRCKDRDPRIDAVIALIFHEQEECGEGKDLKDHAAHRNVGILLKDREDPFRANRREKDLQTHNEKQFRVSPQLHRAEDRHSQRQIGKARRHHIDGEHLRRKGRELFSVVHILGTLPHRIGRDAQPRKQQKIAAHRVCKVDFAKVLDLQDVRGVGKGDERENNAHQRFQRIHHRIETH